MIVIEGCWAVRVPEPEIESAVTSTLPPEAYRFDKVSAVTVSVERHELTKFTSAGEAEFVY